VLSLIRRGAATGVGQAGAVETLRQAGVAVVERQAHGSPAGEAKPDAGVS
jgi:hypothetical protein